MKITVDKLNENISRFLREYVVPNAKEKSTLFKIGFGFGIGKVGLGEKKIADMKAAGISDNAGNVDVDILKKGVYGGLDYAGEFHVEGLDIFLNRTDMEKFFRLVETGEIS